VAIAFYVCLALVVVLFALLDYAVKTYAVIIPAVLMAPFLILEQTNVFSLIELFFRISRQFLKLSRIERVFSVKDVL